MKVGTLHWMSQSPLLYYRLLPLSTAWIPRCSLLKPLLPPFPLHRLVPFPLHLLTVQIRYSRPVVLTLPNAVTLYLIQFLML